jgi:hypothetical protein
MLVRAIAILAHASFGFAFHSNTVYLATFFVAHLATHVHLAAHIHLTPSAAKAGTDLPSFLTISSLPPFL